jgi:hypothetical protein
MPKEDDNSGEWFLNERNSLQNYSEQLIKTHERKDFVFLVALFSDENIIEMANIFLGTWIKNTPFV